MPPLMCLVAQRCAACAWDDVAVPVVLNGHPSWRLAHLDAVVPVTLDGHTRVGACQPWSPAHAVLPVPCDGDTRQD